MKYTIEPPWNSYQKKLNALFERDPEVTVGEIYKPEKGEKGEANYAIDVEIRNHEKFLALDRLLAKEQEFGNVKLVVVLYDEANATNENRIDLYRTAFAGNPIVKDIKEVIDFTGTACGFVRFRPEIIQFFDDNIGDFEGNWSGLAQDIAAEVFACDLAGVHFCTANVKEPG